MSIAVGTTSALTPLNSNFAGLKKRVAAYVQGSQLTSVLADAGLALNGAIDKLNTRNWHWLNRQSDLTLVADTSTYTVPANFKRPRAAELLDSSNNKKGYLSFQIAKEFQDTQWEDATSGSPRFYTVRNAVDDRLLTLNVPPSTSFVASYPTIRLTYFARLGHFSDNGDTLGDLEAPPEIANFLVWYARWDLATQRGAAGQIDRAEKAWRIEWKDLVVDDTDEQTDYITWERFR